MKIKYLKLESGDNFNLNTLLEEVKHEYLDVSHKFKLENDTLKIKDTFQHINFLLKFYNCFYVKRNSGLITQIENYEVEAHEKNYERGFLKGYKKATIPDINNSFKIIKGGYDLIYNLPKEYHLERYLLVDKSTREKDYYYDEQERKIEYCNLCFYDYGKSVGEYIARWDALLSFYVNGGLTKQNTEFNETNQEQIQKMCLVNLFEHTSKYKKIMDILVSKEYIIENTHFWIDQKKGNKSFLASLILDFHAKGYYKTKPSIVQIKAICQNTFGLNISIDTVKKAKPSNFNLSFIPFESSL